LHGHLPPIWLQVMRVNETGVRRVSVGVKHKINKAWLLPLACLVLVCPGIFAGAKKIKKARAADNPPQYAAFSEPLSEGARYRHALDRLTFGPRPGDLAAVKEMGLGKWLDLQLHPERVPENPALLERLAPLESLRMSMRETYTHYPSQQMIAQVARGKAPLPDDPELRAIVARLADRYMAKQQAKAETANPPQSVEVSIGDQTMVNKTVPPAQAAGGSTTVVVPVNPNDDADLDLKVKLTDILTPDQITILKTGKPDEKRQILESIPQNKRFDFVYALHQQQRQQLFNLAPVALRRELMLSVNPQNVVANDLSEGKLQRAIYSDHQLQELLVDFWFNHFNVYMNKGAERYSLPTYERDVIRPRVFGKFYDLLLETAKSPAMLFYLDNWESVGPGAPENRNPNANPKRIKRGLNENYGRELLELHTLGVDNGYTQQDVINVARCLTGWTIANPRKGGGFEYNDKMHDKGPKLVLGHKIPAGGGMNDGLEVLSILAHQPATAHFISWKLAKAFVADDPPPSLVNRMAATFLASDGDLRKVMETMLTSGEFWSKGAYFAKVKTPFQMVVSAVRATNADVTSAFLLTNELQKLGEPLYRKIEPTGYSSANAEWVSSASLLDRMNFALALANNRVPGVKIDITAWQPLMQKDPIDLARYLLEQDLSPATQGAIEKALNDSEMQKQLMQNAKAGAPRLPSLVAGLALGSPEFQKR
jgi:uncharacterized protein (DUF1800 family)